MRLAAGLLFVALTGSLSLAEEAKPADPKAEVTKRKVPLRVVRMLPETRQVLLLDKNRGTHVVAEVGQEIDGFIVDEIEGDEVTLVSASGAEIILTAPEPSWRRRAAERKAAARAGAAVDPTLGATGATVAGAAATGASPDGPAPLDPYADVSSSSSSSSSPDLPGAAPIVAGEGGVRVASATDTAPTAAPIVDSGAPAVADPYGDLDPGIAAFVDAVGATPAPGSPPSSPGTPVAPVPSAAPSPAPSPSAPPSVSPAATSSDPTLVAAGSLAAAATGSPVTAAPAGTTVTVTRREVDAALADFGATAVTFDAAFVADGLRFEHIASGTILARLGLQKGDVLTSVDQQRLRSLDDAASLYARAGTTKTATLHVLRGGKPLTVRVTIR